MATNFPSSLDNFTNPVSGNTLDSPSHSLQHSDANDAIEALENKLGIGDSPAGSATSGYVLMAGSGGTTTWSALPSSGALTLIKTYSPSSVASIDFDANTFSSTYKNYFITWNLSGTTGAILYLKFKAASTVVSTGYKWGIFKSNYGTTPLADGSSAATYILIGYNTGASTTFAGQINVFSPKDTQYHYITFQQSSDASDFSGAGTLQNTTSYDSAQIGLVSGNLTGTISVYGYSK